MWIALKLLASGAFEAAVKGLSAALQWLLSDWRNMALAGTGAALVWTLVFTVPGLRTDLSDTRADLTAEQAAHLGTVNAFLAASEQAQKDAEANAQRVAREQEIITHEVTRDLRGDLAAVTARFDRLRASAARAASGRADPAGLPGAGDAAGRAAGAPGDHDLRTAGDLSAQSACPIGLVCLTIDEAERASQDAARHNRLIDWLIGQSAVRFTPEGSR